MLHKITFFLFLFFLGVTVNAEVPEEKVKDRLIPVTFNGSELGGELDRRIRNVIYGNYMKIDLDRDWLEHFCNREERNGESHVYYGIGKVIDAGSLFTAYTGDEVVAARTQHLIDTLLSSRDPDGYLGFWKPEPEGRQNHINWILHEQEYITLGLVRHYLCTGDEKSLEAARVMGDYIMRTFPTPQNLCFPPEKICTAGLPEAFLALYRATEEKKYLDFAADTPHGSDAEIRLGTLREWKQDFSTRPCHVYVMLARTYAQTELYRIDGSLSLMDMTQFMLRELLERGYGGLLVTGSCSEGEHFTYNQNGAGAIGESCVTAYMLRWMDSIVRRSGHLCYGDIMERTIYNALFAASSPDGRQIRYFTPFSGDRQYDSRDGFCCCGNFRRAIGELPQKVAYRTPEGRIILNLYTNFKKTFDVNGTPVTLSEETKYPTDGEVKITMQTEKPVRFQLLLRQPAWCNGVTVQVNDEKPEASGARAPYSTIFLDREWKSGDVVKISMPMRVRLVQGRALQAGRVALLRGPVVFCVGKELNEELFRKYPNCREWVLDPATIGEIEPDTRIRPDGIKFTAKIWPDAASIPERDVSEIFSGILLDTIPPAPVEVVFTEFIDPSGQEVYFKFKPRYHSLYPVDDELLFYPSRHSEYEITAATYGPEIQNTADVQSAFAFPSEAPAADLARDYVPPEGKPDVPAVFPTVFPDSVRTGTWTVLTNGEILNSSKKAFGIPLYYAYGCGSGDELGFLSNYAPTDAVEEKWRTHYSDRQFARGIPKNERSEYVFTHPLSDPQSAVRFRWEQGAGFAEKMAGKNVILAGDVLSNTGNGVNLTISTEAAGTLEKLCTAQGCAHPSAVNLRNCSFRVGIPAEKVGKYVDFTLDNNGAYDSDAAALRLRIYVSDTPNLERDVTREVQKVYQRAYQTEFPDIFTTPGYTLKLKCVSVKTGEARYFQLREGESLNLQ